MFSKTYRQTSSMAVASGESECDTIESVLPEFDEYGFLIPRDDQDCLESRSHEYR